MNLTAALAAACVAGAFVASRANAQVPGATLPQSATLALVEGVVMATRGTDPDAPTCELTVLEGEGPHPPLPATAELVNEGELLMASAIIGKVASCELDPAPEPAPAPGATATITVTEGVVTASYGAESACELAVIMGEPTPKQHSFGRVEVKEGVVMVTQVVADRFVCEMGEADPALAPPTPFVPPPVLPPEVGGGVVTTPTPLFPQVPVPSPAPPLGFSTLMPVPTVAAALPLVRQASGAVAQTATLELAEGVVLAKRGTGPDAPSCVLTVMEGEGPHPPLPATAELVNEGELLVASAIIGKVASCELDPAPEPAPAPGAMATSTVTEGVVTASYGAESACELAVIMGEPTPKQHSFGRVEMKEGVVMVTQVVADRFTCEMGEADPALA